MTPATDPRALLIATGMKMARRMPLSEADPDLICERARLPRSAFDEAFPSLTEFVIALQQHFMDALRDRMFALTTGVPPGMMRLKLATEVYLEACLGQHALRAWLIEGRRDPRVAARLQVQNQNYTLLIAGDFAAAGWPAAAAAARLYVAMANEASFIEHSAGQKVPDARDTLWHFLDHAAPQRAVVGPVVTA